MDERLRFVARLLEAKSMSPVCREFGISRKTGYKIYERYCEHGLEALMDRSRRPVRYRRLHMLLRRESYAVDRKRGQRLYREERLAVCRRGGRKRAMGTRRPIETPSAPNQRWSLE